ncbi:MAG: RNA polymerase sigma factor [Candidatus Ornithobacterium hominis]|nr:RNA polymerase sigma factor [Candidatus Ornithobacterium hominis]
MVEDCKKNDPSAQKKLYDLLSPAMFAVCLSYFNCEDDAQESFQLAFIKVFRDIRKFNHKGSFEGWVRRIMVNQCIDNLRKKKKENWVALNESTTPVQEDEVLDDDFTAQELLKEIQNLPPQYRMVFNLYFLEDFSHKEIAEMLGISESTSKSNLHRAKAKLKEELQKKYKK